jgi:serine/threonine-protein kinase
MISGIVHGLRREVREARRLGAYTLEKKIGEGGMGVVYQANHALLRRSTAIKLLSPEKTGETNLKRFEQEVRLTARLTHPNTVTVFDFGHTPDGLFYYAMELLDGADLEQIIEVGGPMPTGRALKVLSELAGALEEAHGIGLIHRDIKPGNVILCTQGGKPDVAKLVDFGLVKELVEGEDAGITRPDTVLGTPRYLAPEVARSPDEVGERSDLYAVGAVGYFLLTGHHVFEGRTLVEIMGHHMHTEPQSLSEKRGEPVAEDVETLILDCLAKSPDARPASARALLQRIFACRDFGTWTEDDARTWWQVHSDELALSKQSPASSSGKGTLDIALDDQLRGAA